MTTATKEFFLVSQEEIHHRLDKLLSLRFPDCSRTYFQSLIEKDLVQINQSPCKKREHPRIGDEISVCFELTPELTLTPENIPLTILFEDDDLLVVNKPAGMVVHPAPGHFQGTFVNALLFHCKALSFEAENSLRPGIVHRLDKDTSGVLLAAKTSYAHKALVSCFSERKIQKYYKAICLSSPSVTEINAPIARHQKKRQEMAICEERGRQAITKLEILAKNEKMSLLDLELITGRTHQIRVHLKHIGCPILGDIVYGQDSANQKWAAKRQMLHAERVIFPHPRTGKLLEITAPMPDDMQGLISHFFS